MILLVFLVSVMESVSTDKPSCGFVPDTRLNCVEYITFPDHDSGCCNSMDILEVTGLTKDIEGEIWINVLDKHTKVIRLYNTDELNLIIFRSTCVHPRFLVGFGLLDL
jgi:hypothetical protein